MCRVENEQNFYGLLPVSSSFIEIETEIEMNTTRKLWTVNGTNWIILLLCWPEEELEIQSFLRCKEKLPFGDPSIIYKNDYDRYIAYEWDSENWKTKSFDRSLGIEDRNDDT